MNFVKFISIVYILLLSSCSNTSNGTEYSTIRSYTYPILVGKTIIDKGGNKDIELEKYGSGVLYASNYLLTAAHVVVDNGDSEIYVKRGDDIIKAKIIKIDVEKDLAVLKLNLDCPCATLASAPPAIDQVVYLVGFPRYSTYMLQFLTIGNMQGFFKSYTITTGATAPGGSGGGLFTKNNDTFELSGIVVAVGTYYTGSDNNISVLESWLVYSVSINEIRSFLNSIQTQK